MATSKARPAAGEASSGNLAVSSRAAAGESGPSVAAGRQSSLRAEGANAATSS